MASPTFPQFPRLPQELRNLIWKAALPGPRVINLRFSPAPNLDLDQFHLLSRCRDCPRRDGNEDEPSADESDGYQRFDYWEGDYDHAHDSKVTFQTQLERYGFRSSRKPKPLPPQRGAAISGPRNREQYFISNPTPMPILLQVCRESSAYIQSQGWIRALGTPISPAIYINFAIDTLYLSLFPPLRQDFRASYGGYRIPLSYFASQDLLRVRHVAFLWDDSDSTDCKKVAHIDYAIELLRQFGTLETYIWMVRDRDTNSPNFAIKRLGSPIEDPGPSKYPLAGNRMIGLQGQGPVLFPVTSYTTEGLVKMIWERFHVGREFDVRMSMAARRIPRDVWVGAVIDLDKARARPNSLTLCCELCGEDRRGCKCGWYRRYGTPPPPPPYVKVSGVWQRSRTFG